jgi:hypothetical protein
MLSKVRRLNRNWVDGVEISDAHSRGVSRNNRQTRPALQDGFAVRNLDFHGAQNRNVTLRRFRARRRASFRWSRGRVEPVDLDDGMNLPGRGAPGIMIAVPRDGTNGGADVLRVVVMLVVPQQVAGEPDLLGLVDS